MRPLLVSIGVPVVLLGVAAAGCGGKVTFETGNGGNGGAGATTTNVAVVNGTTAGKAGSTTNGITVAQATGQTAVNSAQEGTVGVSTVVGVSASTGSPTFSVPCGGQNCNSDEICCFNPNGPGDHCGQSGQCDAGYVELQCNGPSDCPNAICCATFDQNTQKYQGIACQATCDGPDEITLCSNNPPSQCPMGEQCHQSQQLGMGYRICN